MNEFSKETPEFLTK